MDHETGENSIIDRETGEVPEMGRLDSETGELELVRKQPEVAYKRPFKVPAIYIKPTPEENDRERAVSRRIYTKSSPFTPVILFLLPSVFLFTPMMAAVLATLEILLHAWAHKKNNVLRQNNITHVYYQSPMHIVASHFCATCRYENTKEEIGKLQDKWNRRFIKYSMEYVKQVV